MKPIYLSFSAFGPYLNKQEIDFAELSQNGIFLICGETGAGKTAILDAMVYALYGKSSGSTRGDISSMRCQLAPNDKPTELEYIFEIRGARYKFTRTIKYGRKNFSVSQNAMYLSGGVYVPFFENPRIADVEAKAAELLGLNYEQFRQVVMLPQGQFERLLLAKSDEKEKILVSLFGAGVYARAADILYERLLTERRRLDADKAVEAALLQQYGVTQAAQLAQKEEQLKQESAELAKTAALLEKRYAEIKEALQQAALINEKFKSLAEAEKNADKLFLQNESMLLLAQALEKAERAEAIRAEYSAVSAAHSAFAEREKALLAEQLREKELYEQRESAQKALLLLTEKAAENTERTKRLAYLESKAESYEALEQADALFEKADKERSGALKEKETAERAAQLAAKQCDDCSRAVALAQAEYQNLLKGYIDGISGVLASQLESGAPCPVCGSTEHPMPAKNSTEVTDARLEAARLKAEQAAKSYTPAQANAQEAAKAFAEAEKAFAEANLTAQRMQERKNNLLGACEKDIKSLSELKAAQTRLSAEIKAYEAGLSQKQAVFNDITAQYDMCRARTGMHKKELESAQINFEAAKTAFYNALSKNGFQNTREYTSALMEKQKREEASADISRCRAELAEAKKQAQGLSEELKDKERPDMDGAEKQLAKAKEEMLFAAQQAALGAEKLSQITKAHTEIVKMQEKYIKADTENRENLLFAKLLRGDNGISLQRYVLGVMLNMVLKHANTLLERVHSGRYVLYRTLEASGGTRKAGLELEVLDRYSGERRGVATLSGGEKFLAALSLSIGLSTVVQAQSGGIALEAMFIDEGFGSLDPASISDALSILAAVKSSAAAVGIISHVESMKENIISKISVEKSGGGSKLVIRY